MFNGTEISAVRKVPPNHSPSVVLRSHPWVTFPVLFLFVSLRFLLFKSLLHERTHHFACLLGNLEVRDSSCLNLRPIRIRPIDVIEFSSWLIDAFVSMGAEVVALGLQEILRQSGGTVAIEVGQGR